MRASSQGSTLSPCPTRACTQKSCNVESLQAASAARLMRAEDVRAAVRESADLGQWLGPKAHDLLAAPLEIIAFSDEEGVRRAPFPFQGSRQCYVCGKTLLCVMVGPATCAGSACLVRILHGQPVLMHTGSCWPPHVVPVCGCPSPTPRQPSCSSSRSLSFRTSHSAFCGHTC